MVSLNTLFTLGIIGAGLLAFTSLGGAGGIGQRLGGSLGGGIRSFNENISTSFNQALQGLNPFAAAQESAASTISGITDSISGVSPQLPSEYNTSPSGVDTTSAPRTLPIATSFKPQVISGVVEPEFASKYSFVPPQKGKLDVSNAFDFINRANKPFIETRRASIQTTTGKNYGGYGSETSQNTALASLIQTNANKYSEWFS